MATKKLSFYNNIKIPQNDKKDFLEIIQIIKSTIYKSSIENLRQQLYGGNDELAKTTKESLPAFTPSGVFKNDHKATSLIEYSGIIHVDIDKISELELNELEQKIKNSNDILAFFRSPSGKGLKVFFKCDDIKENHTKNIIKLLSYFKNKYGIEPDKSCKDINRLCFISFDQNAFYNENAIV